MLPVNPLQPPRPSPAAGFGPHGAAALSDPGFITAEDFDGTGIMMGVDPCDPRYWWMPEDLYGPGDPDPAGQATSRPATRPPAAA